MGTFYLKNTDTGPALQVVLKNPDGTVRDLTGVTAVDLIINLSNDVVLERTMSVVGDPTLGTVRYSWQAADWDDLYPSPVIPASGAGRDRAHRMEYRVTGSSPTDVITYPNGPTDDPYDVLQITDSLEA